MRVNVKDIDGIHASTLQAGQRLYSLIEPVLARGEPVVLDFAGVRHFSVPFFNYSIGLLVEKDEANRLGELLRYENLPAPGQSAWESVVEYAVRRRGNPRLAEAMDQAARKLFERD
jgi:STAS-like domain of unknown function (DUF4325)